MSQELTNKVNRKQSKRKGSFAADPVRSLEDIKRIRTWFYEKKNYYMWLLCAFGFNTAIRGVDLIQLKVSDVLDEGGSIRSTTRIIEQKTEKEITIEINQVVKGALEVYFGIYPELADNRDSYLFVGRQAKGRNRQGEETEVKHISKDMVNKNLKKAQKALGIDEMVRISVHSFRKTWGYHAFKTFGVRIQIIQGRLNHSSQAETLRYIGITADDIKESFDMVQLG